MTILSKLNLTDKTKAAMLTSPENRVRAKMLDAIETQIGCARGGRCGRALHQANVALHDE